MSCGSTSPARRCSPSRQKSTPRRCRASPRWTAPPWVPPTFDQWSRSRLGRSTSSDDAPSRLPSGRRGARRGRPGRRGRRRGAPRSWPAGRRTPPGTGAGCAAASVLLAGWASSATSAASEAAAHRSSCSRNLLSCRSTKSWTPLVVGEQGEQAAQVEVGEPVHVAGCGGRLAARSRPPAPPRAGRGRSRPAWSTARLAPTTTVVPAAAPGRPARRRGRAAPRRRRPRPARGGRGRPRRPGPAAAARGRADHRGGDFLESTAPPAGSEPSTRGRSATPTNWRRVRAARPARSAAAGPESRDRPGGRR